MDYAEILNPANVAMYVGLAIPFLVALVSKKVASSGLKGVLNLLLSSIAGSAVYLASDVDTYDVRGFITASLNTFVVSVAAYYGVYKPTGATASVNSATANFGLGKPVLQTDDTEIPVTVTPEEMSTTGNEVAHADVRNDGRWVPDPAVASYVTGTSDVPASPTAYPVPGKDGDSSSVLRDEDFPKHS